MIKSHIFYKNVIFAKRLFEHKFYDSIYKVIVEKINYIIYDNVLNRKRPL